MSLPLHPNEIPDGDGSMRALLRSGDFVRFWLSKFVATLAVQIQAVTVGWQVYVLGRAHGSVEQAAFLVGMVGLAQFIPVVVLTLNAGENADRHDRRRTMVICEGIEVICSIGLTLLALTPGAPLWAIFGFAMVFGAARTFFSPASSATAPLLVTKALLPRAIAWNSLSWQTGSVAGPALGGLLVAISPAHAYGTAALLSLTSVVLLTTIRTSTRPQVQPGSRWTLVKEGLSYVWTNKVVFGAISLDLFAVLLGGATALLPVFARDVLHVGADGFGILRSAPAVGASVVALLLASITLKRHAGLIMFTAVGVFGAATVVFGLSKLMWLSVAALVVLGAADMVSVYVRQTLVQIVTPDHMRGRVASVSGLFIGASNELGEFESGVAARLLGPVGAALFGGVGALIVTASWAALFPALRRVDRLA